MDQEEKNYRQPWFKFYAQDWLTDIKIRRMSVVDRICYITLICLASSSTERGSIKGCMESDIIDMSHLGTEDVIKAIGCLDRFERNGSVTTVRNADQTLDITVNNFAKRQASSSTNAERQKKYREKQKTAQPSSTDTRNDSNRGVVTEVTYRGDKRRVEKSREDIGEGVTPKMEAEDFFKMVEEGGERSEKFIAMLAEVYGVDPNLIRIEIKKFCNHWEEKNRNGTRKRWELEAVFEVRRRLATWFRNAQKWEVSQKSKGKKIV